VRPSLQSSVNFEFARLEWRALPSGALFLPAEDLLVVSDLHLGKSYSFASRGQLLPPSEVDLSLDLLVSEVRSSQAARLVCLGDSFHDSASIEGISSSHFDTLESLSDEIEWTWVTGNHDEEILKFSEQLPFKDRVVGSLPCGEVLLEHQPPSDIPPDEDPLFRVFGHFHPKMRIMLSGNMKTTGKCFLASEKRLCMPAFGAFAGGLNIENPALSAAVGQTKMTILCRPPNIYRVDPDRIVRN